MRVVEDFNFIYLLDQAGTVHTLERIGSYEWLKNGGGGLEYWVHKNAQGNFEVNIDGTETTRDNPIVPLFGLWNSDDDIDDKWEILPPIGNALALLNEVDFPTVGLVNLTGSYNLGYSGQFVYDGHNFNVSLSGGVGQWLVSVTSATAEIFNGAGASHFISNYYGDFPIETDFQAYIAEGEYEDQSIFVPVKRKWYRPKYSGSSSELNIEKELSLDGGNSDSLKRFFDREKQWMQNQAEEEKNLYYY